MSVSAVIATVKRDQPCTLSHSLQAPLLALPSLLSLLSLHLSLAFRYFGPGLLAHLLSSCEDSLFYSSSLVSGLNPLLPSFCHFNLCYLSVSLHLLLSSSLNSFFIP